MKDYYSILGIPRYTDSMEVIKKAYREQIQFFHPDNGNVPFEIAEEKTKDLNWGYNVLMSAERKAEYDRELAEYLLTENQTAEMRLRAGYEYFKNIQPDISYQGNRSAPAPEKSKKKVIIAGLVVFGLILIILNAVNTSTLPPSSKGSSSSQTATQAATQALTQAATQAPKATVAADPDANLTPVYAVNGTVYKKPTGEAPCQFTVKTSSGSNYYIYMKNLKGYNDLAFYVTGGNTVTKDIPLGSYKLYYCTGDTWYGPQHKFGSKTAASTSDDIFTFSSTVSGNYIYYDTWEVTLYKVSGGNMETEKISMDEFPD